MSTIRKDAPNGPVDVTTTPAAAPATVVTGMSSGVTTRVDAAGASQGTTTQTCTAGGTMKA